MFSIFKKKQPTIVKGLTADEVMSIRKAIVNEYDEAKRRQKCNAVAPNQYMVGLRKALKIIDSMPIHTIAEVR